MTASLTFVGTATTVLRLGGFTLLTDPNFVRRGQRVHLGYGLTSKRRTDPALTPAELPAYDALVLSHLHGDHFDRVARRELPKAPPVVTTAKAAETLRKWGFGGATGLDHWADWQTSPRRRAPDDHGRTRAARTGGRAPAAAAGDRHRAGSGDAVGRRMAARPARLHHRRHAERAAAERGHRAVPGRRRHGGPPRRHEGARRARHDGRPAGHGPGRARPAGHRRPGPLRRLRRLREPALRLRRRRWGGVATRRC